MPSKKYLVSYGIIMVIPLVATLIVYPFMPDMVPTSFNDYVAKDFTNKNIVFFVDLLMLSISILMIGILMFVRKINIKRFSIIKMKSDFRIIMAYNVFLSLMAILLLYTFGYYDESNPFKFMFWAKLSAMVPLIYAFFEILKVKRLEKGLTKEVEYAE